MSIFRRPDYESEVTQFIQQLKTRRPQLESEQQTGRNLLWDKTIDRGVAAELRSNQVQQAPYVYATSPTQ